MKKKRYYCWNSNCHCRGCSSSICSLPLSQSISMFSQQSSIVCIGRVRFIWSNTLHRGNTYSANKLDCCAYCLTRCVWWLVFFFSLFCSIRMMFAFFRHYFDKYHKILSTRSITHALLLLCLLTITMLWFLLYSCSRSTVVCGCCDCCCCWWRCHLYMMFVVRRSRFRLVWLACFGH